MAAVWAAKRARIQTARTSLQGSTPYRACSLRPLHSLVAQCSLRSMAACHLYVLLRRVVTTLQSVPIRYMRHVYVQ